MTDPGRVADPMAVALRFPRGGAVIHRTFGAPDGPATALKLRALTRRRGQLLLIGADARLAAAARADGVHLPERMLDQLARLRAKHPNWIITTAAHSPRAFRRAVRAGADAVLLSAVFPSRSPSARRPLGIVRFARLAAGVSTPVFALGGVNGRTAGRAAGAGAAGLAGVEVWLD